MTEKTTNIDQSNQMYLNTLGSTIREMSRRTVHRSSVRPGGKTIIENRYNLLSQNLTQGLRRAQFSVWYQEGSTGVKAIEYMLYRENEKAPYREGRLNPLEFFYHEGEGADHYSHSDFDEVKKPASLSYVYNNGQTWDTEAQEKIQSDFALLGLQQSQ